MLAAMLELGVLISGRGSNLQAILDAAGAGALPARVRVVISNKAEAAGLARAADAGVPTRVVPHNAHPDRPSFDRALVAALREAGAEWVVLAGFMRLLTPTFLDAFPHRVINIHPSLLPAFPGTDAQAQAIGSHQQMASRKPAGCAAPPEEAAREVGADTTTSATPITRMDLNICFIGPHLPELTAPPGATTHTGRVHSRCTIAFRLVFRLVV